MGGILRTHIVLFCVSLYFVDAEGLKVYPSSQKVAANSPVIFTCVSFESDGEFSWYRSGKLVDEEKDEVTIKLLDDNKSVLKIDRADIKKHKKTFTCSFSTDNGVVEEASIGLKVLPVSRLHKYFPHITPIRGGDDVIQEAPDGQMKLKCFVNIDKNLPQWRWIKDGYTDLQLTSQATSGKISISADGELTIFDVSSDDSGMYMCVAENNRGTSYSSSFRVSIVQDALAATSCRDESGYQSKVGETYKLAGDICTTCSCEEGGILRCRSISCFPLCPYGQVPEMSEDECCAYECISMRAEVEDDDDNQCRDKDDKIISEGMKFNPSDPCTTCLCRDGQAVECAAIVCVPPNCLGYRLKPGTCCDFLCPGDIDKVADGNCIDRDGKEVMLGDYYMPEEDPCKQCECNNEDTERCMMVACSKPTCPYYKRSRDKCCEYTCLDTPPLPTFPEGGCTDFHGRTARYGEMFQPGTDACMMCECLPSGLGECHLVTCDEPTCRDYKLIPGTCCGFTCPDDDEIDTVSVNLDETCRAYNGSMVPSGATYHPTRNQCYRCTCVSGEPQSCITIEGCSDDGHSVPPLTSNSMEKVLGRIVMQQIGKNDAIVQWSVPKDYEDKQVKFTVSYHDMSTNKHHFVHVDEDTYLILRDLKLNNVYDIHVNGTVGTMPFSTIPMPFRFSLHGRGHSSLVLNNALGQVFMSRGSIAYDGYSLPREFEPVARNNDVDILLNVKSFHMVEISKYNETPCPDQDCGLIRFYMFGMDGDLQNVVSLMFASHQDFLWAKSHL